jgi:5-methylcytosine-specific restriction endonuclease McrA
MTLEEKKSSRSAANKKWRLKNLGRQYELTRIWQVEHREYLNRNAREKYALDPKACAAKTREKRDKNRARFNEWTRNWNKKHPEHKARRVAYTEKRRALKNGCQVDAALVNQFIENVRSREVAVCVYCDLEIPASTVHFDHIVPLSRGGAHIITNICVSCPSCNLRKSAKLIGEWIPPNHSLN